MAADTPRRSVPHAPGLPRLRPGLGHGGRPADPQPLRGGHARQLPDGVQTVSTTHNAWPLELEDEPVPTHVDERALTTWAELTMAGEIRPGPPVLGWDVVDRQIVRLRWKEDLGSVGVFGMSGSGKTTAGVVLAAQVAKAECPLPQAR